MVTLWSKLKIKLVLKKMNQFEKYLTGLKLTFSQFKN